ncbi:MAG TPA: YdeI/OmpD-associated family protein [Vicinamibacterales bacterium]|jgi:hypothetical protein|nr:YdeI/OmpD-associated family protein [Vicinamibacterales bacterium]
MVPKDPRIDACIAKASPFARPILRRFRKAVHGGCPDVVETTKWQNPAFDHKGPLAGMAAFKAHCAVGFWKESLMKSGLKGGEMMGPFARLESIDQLPDEKTLIAMVKEAAALNDAGAKLVRNRTPKPPPKAPAFLVAALKKRTNAWAHWEAFPPSHTREYIDWITEAKQGETRTRRLDKAIARIAEGKSQNWKYER